MRLESKGICIRDFNLQDIKKKVEWINNPQNNKYLHYDLPLNEEKTRNWFLNKDNTTRKDCVIEFNGYPVGLIGLLGIDKQNRKAEFYISMGEDSYKQKGIATEATKLIVIYAFNDLNLNKVYLNVDEKNVAACRLYEKSGFICEGLFKMDMVKNNEYIDRKRYAIFNTRGKRV